MVRTVIIPEDTHIELDIPSEYVGKKVEVTYLALDELDPIDQTPKKTMRDLWGILSDESAENLRKAVAESKDEWERDI